jgi:hypothetical protein
LLEIRRQVFFMRLSKAERLAIEAWQDPESVSVLRRAMPSVSAPLPVGNTAGMKRLAAEVCARHGFGVEVLARTGRKGPVVTLRREFVRAAYERGEPVTKIAKFIKRTHGAVLNLLRH